ncbi:MAG TPA: uL15m family ribosomal protein [Methanoregulaceae archaeon]|nr:uL15m family ribosomal protein [Methanoregulaceae archaeon]HOV66800.1 uL15m family ribosomal protein [Methanoregulaceae archaeon]HQJ88456.1 uL15m family ribosomal protein [Methanoregulaceae archaeon]
MPVNKRSKYRGSRTCGGGTHKNRRGAGNRGGRGRAGINAHRFTKFYLEEGPVFGKNGFVAPNSRKVPTIDIGTLDRLADALLAQHLASEEDGAVVIDVSALGFEKVLGSGRVTRPLRVSACAFSEQAIAKIEAQGGQANVV